MMNPNTAVFKVGGTKEAQVISLKARDTYNVTDACELACSTKKPPYQTGYIHEHCQNWKSNHTSDDAWNHKKLERSIEKTSMASICSVERMSAKAAPMSAPPRPATSKPVTRGPSSLKNEID